MSIEGFYFNELIPNLLSRTLTLYSDFGLEFLTISLVFLFTAAAANPTTLIAFGLISKKINIKFTCFFSDMYCSKRLFCECVISQFGKYFLSLNQK